LRCRFVLLGSRAASVALPHGAVNSVFVASVGAPPLCPAPVHFCFFVVGTKDYSLFPKPPFRVSPSVRFLFGSVSLSSKTIFFLLRLFEENFCLPTLYLFLAAQCSFCFPPREIDDSFPHVPVEFDIVSFLSRKRKREKFPFLFFLGGRNSAQLI